MGSRDRAVMDLESRAVSARVTKHFVTDLDPNGLQRLSADDKSCRLQGKS